MQNSPNPFAAKPLCLSPQRQQRALVRSYPRAFGRAVADLVGQRVHPRAAELEAVADADMAPTLAWLRQEHTDLWADAKMEEVLRYLLSNKYLDLGCGVC